MKKLLISLLSLGLFSSSAIAFDPNRPRYYPPLPYSGSPHPHVMVPPPPPHAYRHPHPRYHQPYHSHRRNKDDAGKAIAIGAAALMLGIIINEAARR